MKLTHAFFACWSVLLMPACRMLHTPSPPVVRQFTVRDTVQDQSASEIERFLQPYRDSLKQFTEAVLGEAKGSFRKEKPGGSLGNLVVDALFEEALHIDPHVRGAIFNYGGIRLPDLMQGPVTRGKLLELLPFDNELVLLTVRGDTLQTWLNLIAEKGGWPVQFGKILWCTNGKITALGLDTIEQRQPDATVQRSTMERKIEKDSMYTIATIDYVANGGDNCEFLKTCPRKASGKLARDIVSAYIQQHQVIVPDTLQRIQFLPKR